ncbi:MAG: WG repeat-containing protein [candidate division WOR-3 bacterium]|nr:MAG: WG repeat-containing protein [candidate division WOR-3 bacterium]
MPRRSPILLLTMLVVLVFGCATRRARPPRLFPFRDSQKRWGYIDRHGKTVIDPQFPYASEFSEGLAFVSLPGREWGGYIDEKGRMGIGPSRAWTHGQPFSEGRAAVWNYRLRLGSRQDKTGGVGSSRMTRPARYIDRTGEYITDRWFARCLDFSEGIGCACVSGSTYAVNRAGDLLFSLPGFVGPFSEGLAAASRSTPEGPESGYVDITGKEVIPPRPGQYHMPFQEGLALVVGLDEFGLRFAADYIDRTGNLALQTPYRVRDLDLACFREGLAVVRDSAGCFHMDHDARPQYAERWSMAKPFSEGLAAVRVNDSTGRWVWGYIDRTGKLRIPPSLHDAFEFKGGVAQVVLEGNRWCCINKKGELLGLQE